MKFALNDRQLMLLEHAQQHPNTSYYVEPYRRTHKIAYDTARTDLIKLADAGLLTKQQRGKAFVFKLNID